MVIRQLNDSIFNVKENLGVYSFGKGGAHFDYLLTKKHNGYRPTSEYWTIFRLELVK